MAQCNLIFFKNKVIPLILAFVFVLSSLEYGSTIAWAQEINQGTGQTMPSGTSTGSVMHNPCFPNAGNGTYSMQHYGNMTGSSLTHQYGKNGTRGNGTHHSGQHGSTGAGMSHSGQYGSMGNGTHNSGQYGNQTGFKMNPCSTSQTPTPASISQTTPSLMQVNAANSSSATSQIPSWVRNNAKWWAQNQVGDSDFIQGVQYLIQQGILKIPPTQVTQSSSTSQPIPAWVKTNAGWWANGQISDSDFVQGIQYLVSSGIIKVT